MMNLTHLSKLYIVIIGLNKRELYKPNMTLLLKIKLGNSYPCQKIDKSLLVKSILS